MQTDVFVFCKKEEDNYCDTFNFVQQKMKKRMELYNKIEKREMIQKHLEYHKQVIGYTLRKLKQLNSSIDLDKCFNDIRQKLEFDDIKEKEFVKLYSNNDYKYKYQYVFGLQSRWALLDTNNRVLNTKFNCI